MISSWMLPNNTVVLVRSVIKFLDRNFLFIEKARTFEIKIKFKSKNFIARRAKSVINSYQATINYSFLPDQVFNFLRFYSFPVAFLF